MSEQENWVENDGKGENNEEAGSENRKARLSPTVDSLRMMGGGVKELWYDRPVVQVFTLMRTQRNDGFWISDTRWQDDWTARHRTFQDLLAGRFGRDHEAVPLLEDCQGAYIRC